MREPADRAPLAPTSLPWLAPGAASLIALSRPQGNPWPEVRHDPGVVLLLARFSAPDNTLPFPSDALSSPAPLHFAASRLGDHPSGVLDPARPGPDRVLRTALVLGRLNRALALRRRDCDPEQAWCCGLLAPLGWLALSAVAPDRVADCLDDTHWPRSPAATLQRHSLPDPALLARRLARAWRLPDWLRGVIGQLDFSPDYHHLHSHPPILASLTRVSVALARTLGHELDLCAPGNCFSEERALGWRLTDLLPEELLGAEPAPPPPVLTCPYATPHLPQLLESAAANRELRQGEAVSRLESEVDALHLALREQDRRQSDRLERAKLLALAELAAGAGHEINNPLAVISGEAQYLLSHQGDWLASDGEGKARKALNTIIGQTRRVHSLLRELMLFARPAAPRPAWVDLPTLLGEVAASLADLAEPKRVRVEVAPRPERLTVFADAEQLRVALTNLLRNAVEAAPPEGWARLAVAETGPGGDVEVTVEDSGPGPTAEQAPHLFDPFYSGRSAGRGRGLGLPVAWRLARNQGGTITLSPRAPGQPTRFILTLPRAAGDERQAA